MTPPPGGPPRLPGARELPRDLTIESRPLVPLEGGRLVDPLAPGPLGLSGGAADLARLGETSLPPPPPGAGLMPGVLNPPDASALALAPDSPPAERGFLGRLWDGFLSVFGLGRSLSGSEEGGRFYSGGDDATVDPAAARRAIALDPAGEPSFSLEDPNPFTRVRIKLEMDMPGSESLDLFLDRLVSRVPEGRRTEVVSILSLLTVRTTGEGTVAVSLRQEVAAEIHASGQGYRNRYQLADAVRTVLARHGLDASALEAGMNPAEREALSSVLHNLSLQLIPDDVPLYRTSGRGVREGATTAVMKANMDGMTYWGVGSDGIATAEEYLSEGRALVTTTVGELRRYGVLTTDDIAKAGNAVELYHDPRETGGWVSIPMRVVNRSLEAGPKSPNLL